MCRRFRSGKLLNLALGQQVLILGGQLLHLLQFHLEPLGSLLDEVIAGGVQHQILVVLSVEMQRHHIGAGIMAQAVKEELLHLEGVGIAISVNNGFLVIHRLSKVVAQRVQDAGTANLPHRHVGIVEEVLVLGLEVLLAEQVVRAQHEGAGLKGILHVSHKLGFSAVFLGAFGGAVNAAKKYITTKVHRDSTITKFQAVQMKFATMLSKYESCRYMVYNCAETANDHNRLQEMLGQSALVKAYVGDTAVEGCVLAMNLMGSYGVMKEYQTERFLRDALIGPRVEGQTDVQRVIAAGYYLNH